MTTIYNILIILIYACDSLFDSMPLTHVHCVIVCFQTLDCYLSVCLFAAAAAFLLLFVCFSYILSNIDITVATQSYNDELNKYGTAAVIDMGGYDHCAHMQGGGGLMLALPKFGNYVIRSCIAKKIFGELAIRIGLDKLLCWHNFGNNR